MYHSITFGSKNTWEDWHLVPTSRPLFLPPKQKKSITDIPGGDGVLDMSEALTGYPVFNNREGSFEFHSYERLLGMVRSLFDCHGGYSRKNS